MDTTKKDVKETIESSKSAEENMKKERLMTVLETVGAFILALPLFMNTAEPRKCIIWGIVLIAWLAVFEIPKRARNKKKEK